MQYMKKIGLLFLLSFFYVALFAQSKAANESLYYYSAKGLTFVPPLSRPGIVKDGKLYIGKRKLSILFSQLNDEKLNTFFAKYKANKTSADVLSITGTVVLPIANLIITAKDGKINWWLFGAALVVNASSNILNIQAQKNLLEATIYYDKRNGFTHIYSPQQATIGITIPLTK